MKTKTLEQSAQELKESIDRMHKAKMNFLRSYMDTVRLDRYAGDSYYQSKFGEKTVIHDWTQN